MSLAILDERVLSARRIDAGTWRTDLEAAPLNIPVGSPGTELEFAL